MRASINVKSLFGEIKKIKLVVIISRRNLGGNGIIKYNDNVHYIGALGRQSDYMNRIIPRKTIRKHNTSPRKTKSFGNGNFSHRKKVFSARGIIN